MVVEVGGYANTKRLSRPILISGVRNYLKEALVNIIAVHAEVSYHYMFPRNVNN
jgi:hypothetical protein